MTLFLFGYLLVLIQRTSFLESSTYVGSDVIIGFHSIATITILLTLRASNYYKLGFRKLLFLVFVCILFTEITFLALNLNGKISVYTKNEKEVSFKQKEF